MKDRPFFDTNVLVYAFSKGDARRSVAESLLADGGVVSVQTLNEFVAVSARKLSKPLPEIREALSIISLACPSPVPLTMQVHETALDLMARYGYHIYDALVIAAALSASCRTLYSEDMQDDQTVESLTIRNPFKPN